MKKLIKIFLTIVLTFIFLLSVSYNIIIFKTSYGSLMFKYDELKYYTMHNLAIEPFSAAYLTKETKDTIEISGESIDGCDIFESKYYVNADKKLHIKTVCIVKGEEDLKTTYYYDGSTLYIDNGNTKSKKSIDWVSYLEFYPEFFSFAQTFLFNKTLTSDENNKTKIDFSFSPFYTFGIKYAYSIGATEYTYRYDLKGRLRKIQINQPTGNAKYEINYTDTKFSFPNLADFK